MSNAKSTPGPWKVVHNKRLEIKQDTGEWTAIIAHVYKSGKCNANRYTMPAEANAALIAAAPETAAERDRLRIVNIELMNALELAAKYLGKAVAEDLMSECVRSPRYALIIANRALANAQVNWPRCEATLAELVEKWNEAGHE